MTSDQNYFLKWYQVEDFWIDNYLSISDMAYNLQQHKKINMAEESETDDDDDGMILNMYQFSGLEVISKVQKT